MNILLTAFGPFDGRLENASSLALRELRREFPALRTRVLPVDAVVAPARLVQAMKLIRPEAVILLGEAADSRRIRLETTAWNELDFRIPDIAGRQPTGRAIRSEGPANHRSTLPLENIHARLARHGHDAEFSDDPGRYLCNQVFYVAMEFLRRVNLPCHAGFIHLPLAASYSTSRAADAVAHAIREIGEG